MALGGFENSFAFIGINAIAIKFEFDGLRQNFCCLCARVHVISP